MSTTFYDNAANLLGAGTYWEYNLAGYGGAWITIVSNLIVNQSEGVPVVMEVFGGKDRTQLSVAYATSQSQYVRASLLRIQPISGSGLSVRIVVSDYNPHLTVQTVQTPALTAGSGSDGSAILDGTMTVFWATLSGSTYSMIRACSMISLTIDPSITLQTNGYSIGATGALVNQGTIQGGTAIGPSQGSSVSPSGLYSGAGGGNGGLGSSGAGVGGSAQWPVSIQCSSFTNSGTITTAGTNGTNGAGGLIGSGGGGGASGGAISIQATASFTNSGTITAIGGTGGAAGSTSASSGSGVHGEGGGTGPTGAGGVGGISGSELGIVSGIIAGGNGTGTSAGGGGGAAGFSARFSAMIGAGAGGSGQPGTVTLIHP